MKKQPKDKKSTNDEQKSNFMMTITSKNRNPFNLSIDLNDCGIRNNRDSFVIGTQLISFLLDRFDHELLQRKVEGKFKPYAVKSTIETMKYTMLYSTITSDPGDNAEVEYTHFSAIDYDYQEEAKEPVSSTKDRFFPGQGKCVTD